MYIIISVVVIHQHKLFLLRLHPPGTLYLLTIDCARTFSLSNATWQPIYSNSLSHPVFFQVVCLRQSCWAYVAPSSVLSVDYDKICIKFASHHLLLYVVYRHCAKNYWILPMHSNVTSKNVSGFTLAGPPYQKLQNFV